jgi:hypothetical protein
MIDKWIEEEKYEELDNWIRDLDLRSLSRSEIISLLDKTSPISYKLCYRYYLINRLEYIDN